MMGVLEIVKDTQNKPVVKVELHTRVKMWLAGH